MNEQVLQLRDEKEKYWEAYIGNQYYQWILKLGIKKDATLVEIAPGTSSKVGQGLAQLNFCGDLIIVEPNVRALEIIAAKYQELLPQARIKPVALTLEDYAISPILKKYPVDLMVSNHALDDFVLREALLRSKQLMQYDAYYTEWRGAEIAAFHWEWLAQEPAFLLPLLKQLSTLWVGLLKGIKAGIMSAYKSYFFSYYAKFYPSLKYPDKVGLYLLECIRKSLPQVNLLNPAKSEWLVYQHASSKV